MYTWCQNTFVQSLCEAVLPCPDLPAVCVWRVPETLRGCCCLRRCEGAAIDRSLLPLCAVNLTCDLSCMRCCFLSRTGSPQIPPQPFLLRCDVLLLLRSFMFLIPPLEVSDSSWSSVWSSLSSAGSLSMDLLPVWKKYYFQKIYFLCFVFPKMSQLCGKNELCQKDFLLKILPILLSRLGKGIIKI